VTFLPIYVRPQTSQPHGRYERQSRNAGPCCRKCGTKYRAASTREVITWYYPQCDCAPQHGISRLRPLRTTSS
jgi:hypothetical protein